jgi:hypothetical protein
MMYCPDCGTGLDDVPVDEPCPQCGGTRRDARIFVHEIGTATEVPTPAIKVGYTLQPWQQKWRDVQHGLEQVEDAYDITQAPQHDNEYVRRVVEDFFKDCRELADWLWQDRQSTGLDEPTVKAYMRGDRDLNLADAIAQTTKHHTRTMGTDPITARIMDINTDPGGRDVTIAWSQPSGASGSEDALGLARRCVDAWRQFLAGRGLQP